MDALDKIIEQRYGKQYSCPDNHPDLYYVSFFRDQTESRKSFFRDQTESRKREFMEEAKKILTQIKGDSNKFLEAFDSFVGKTPIITWRLMISYIRDLHNLYREDGETTFKMCESIARLPTLQSREYCLTTIRDVHPELRIKVLEKIVQSIDHASDQRIAAHNFEYLFINISNMIVNLQGDKVLEYISDVMEFCQRQIDEEEEFWKINKRYR